MIGAPNAGGTAEGTERVRRTGEAYVVFGRPGRAEIDLAGAFGGLRLTGSEPGSQLGRAVGAIGDQNGDGLGEVLVSAPARDAAGRPGAGAVYVVFGRREAGDVAVDGLVEAGSGVRIDGPVGSSAGGALAGRAVSSVDDLNGDGRPEILVTAPRAGTGLPAGARSDGAAYVVFGRAQPGTVDLEALGAGGYTMTASSARGSGRSGEREGAFLGESIESVGDVNGDTQPDLVVGAHLADPTDRPDAGVAYVVFGKGDAAPVDLRELDGRGLRITGVDQQDQTGFDVAPAGDFNGDGIADIAVSSLFAEPLSRPDAGSVSVVFGRRGAGKDIDLAEIGDRALRIAGPAAGDTLGFSVDAIGDVNGDGGPDLAIGATAIDNAYLQNARSTKAGSAYVVFGARGAIDQPAADIVNDPGVQEERRRGCIVSTNVHVLMEDNAYTTGARTRGASA
jgi:hypothetical protein